MTGKFNTNPTVDSPGNAIFRGFSDRAQAGQRSGANPVFPQGGVRHLFYALLLTLIPLHVASAVEGTITERTPDCPYFVVETSEGFAVMEWNGHDKPNRNDRLAGEFTQGFMHVLDNTTRGGDVMVWTELYPVPHVEATKFYRSECQ